MELIEDLCSVRDRENVCVPSRNGRNFVFFLGRQPVGLGAPQTII